MKNKWKRKWKISPTVTLVLLASFVFTSTSLGSPLHNPDEPAVTHTIFLPYIFTSGGPDGTDPDPRPVGEIFGVETSYIDSSLVNRASGVDAYWWRYFAFSWKGIEPNDVSPSQYNWGAVNEHHILDAANSGFSIVATVKYTPKFAQAINDPNSVQCSPIKDDAATIADFQEFVTALVNRYKQPPYNIKYWQFWNEPDVDPDVLIALGELYNSPFGCWGDDQDPYFGGEKYGKFLSIFAQTVKAADPQAKVTNGGMLLSCNPEENPPGCLTGNFFEGTVRGLLANNGMPYLDYVSFHVYGHWYANLTLDEGWAGFQDGGVFIGKIKYLRKIMSEYGVNPLKPLIVTEAGLMCMRPDTAQPLPSGKKCSEMVSPPEFDDDQAEYIVWIYVRAIANDVRGVMWYMLNYHTYRHVGLMFSDGSPKPAYIAYQYMVSQLKDAEYVGTLDQYFPTLRAYEFTRAGQTIWVMWAPDQTNHAITLPAGFQNATDKLGNPISLAPGATSININGPTYLFIH